MSDIPEKIGKYKIVEMVAKGGMGIVYKAKHPNLKHELVIKKLTIRGNKVILDRFKREARLLLELQHANIVRMYDYFTEGSFHYIVLEFVDGMALDKLLKKVGKFSWPTALLLLRDSCKALQFAHSKGVIHRDIKPANILISKKGEIKLADFGIAASEKENTVDEGITQVGVTLGTPAYMPPEQFEDSKNVDARADIYAMGIMLYEMVTGKKPYSGNMVPETIIQINKGQYAAPKKLEPELPPTISRLIKKMMNAKPNKRFKDVESVLKVVNRLLKRYDVREIRVSMVKSMLLKEYEEPNFVPKNKNFIKAIAITAASLCVIAGGIFCWQKGYVHQYLLRSFYTPVTVEVETSKKAFSESSVPMTISFYHADQEDIPRVKNSNRFFELSEIKNSSDVFATEPLYLQEGLYRVKVVVGSDVFWKTLNIDANEQVIRFDMFNADVRSLNIETSATDLSTGQDISDTTEFYVMHENKWILLEDINDGDITTGSVIKVKAESDGYETEYFSLLLEWYQDNLNISALMKKK